MTTARSGTPADFADTNWRRFIAFRVLFNSRFYYPVLAILFLDLGLTPTQYTLLNFAWAIAIVVTDVPAGVMADRLGRKPLVVAAACCMVGEMLLLICAPRNGGMVLFLFCVANRLLSGIAEGMANGADEALVFDSLAERGRSAEWPHALDQVIRWQSVGMIVAMLAGGAVYDAGFLNRAANFFGLHPQFQQAAAIRFPIYLNLVTALMALAAVLGFREPGLRQPPPDSAIHAETASDSWSLLLSAGRWILRTPVALFVLIGGLLLDSVSRLLLTFSSSYFRIIELPTATWGLAGALLAGLGFIVAPIAKHLSGTRSVLANYLAIAALVFAGVIGVACQVPYWGVLFIALLGMALSALNYMMSYYLNRLVDSHHRATVLSFKGLALNSRLRLRRRHCSSPSCSKLFQDNAHPNHAPRRGLPPPVSLWLLLTFALFLLRFRQNIGAPRRADIRAVPT